MFKIIELFISCSSNVLHSSSLLQKVIWMCSTSLLFPLAQFDEYYTLVQFVETEICSLIVNG